ncbi:hypothetical protein CU669_19200 [Paramagnetospirillum kuznetsovii]|uniref:IS110 family transposase n=1 Tax=Paramagnetospirillum kuznetsovii TaxID=2053833 RepID=A0A364NTQ6_9PROT|nr:hypothetical protein CU669_19200 [Paramagnetospirillum kuznetsovii]
MTAWGERASSQRSGSWHKSYRVGGYPVLGLYEKRTILHLLYEAANVLLTSVSAWSSLKAWGMKLARKVGPKRARAAVARKLAVILHRMWTEETDFRHGKQPVAA